MIKKVTNKGVIKGRVKAESGAPGGCEANAPLRVRAKKNDNLVAQGKTNADGSFRIKLPRSKRAGRKYVAAPEKKAGPHFCLNARSSNFKV